jgi:hypothetical protein
MFIYERRANSERLSIYSCWNLHIKSIANLQIQKVGYLNKEREITYC